MCNFCDKIYKNETELRKASFDLWKKDKTELDGGFIKNEISGITMMTLDPDDDHYDHTLYGVKFCPYCGRKIE